MSLPVKSPNELLDKELSLSTSKRPGSQPVPREDAWLAKTEAHAREALAFEDVVTQMFAEAPPSEEATQPITESCVGSGEAAHAGDEPAPKDFSSQLFPQAQPFIKLNPTHAIPGKIIHAKERPNLTAKHGSQTSPCAQPVHNSFILPEKEEHSKKNAAAEATTQPFTQLCPATEGTNPATEESASKELETQRSAEAHSPQESGEESQPFTQPYTLLVDSTDTPEAIESMKTTIRNLRSSDKQKKAQRAEVTSLLPPKLSKYGYTAKTIESETKRDMTAILEYTHSRVPNARLIISHSSKYTKGREMSSSLAIIRPKQPLSSRDTFGVIQRPQDVDFTIDLLHIKNSCGFNCQIIYQPDSDNCLLMNHTGQEICLTSLNPRDPWKVYVTKGWHTIITPGALGLSVSATNISEVDDCTIIVEILLVKKQFNIDIPKPYSHAPQKRTTDHTENEITSTKRQKRKNGQAENPIFQPRLSATSGSIILNPRHEYAARIADLTDGETAIISPLRPNGIRSIAPTVKASYELRRVPTIKSSYQIQRHRAIGKTASSKVFTARHSELSKDLVVKIPRFQDPMRLIPIVKIWNREKTALERCNHPNIVKLFGFDGRILALYLELLPKSLFCGSLYTFQSQDACRLLYGIASALDHLATHQVVHNDIKPKNIAYCRDRGAVLFDFGAATSPKFKQANGGTPWYLPPEFMKTSARGAPGDIWALGITMLYVTGKIQHPDRPSNNWSIVDSRDREKPAYSKALEWLRLISDQRAKLNKKDNLESLVYRMLETEPIQRINAATIITELKAGSLKVLSYD